MVGGFDIKWAIENDMSEYDFMGTCLTDKLRWTDSFHKTLRSRVIHINRFGYLYALVKLRINPSIKYYINSNNFLTKLLNFIIKPQTKINESKFDSHNMMINTDS